MSQEHGQDTLDAAIAGAISPDSGSTGTAPVETGQDTGQHHESGASGTPFGQQQPAGVPAAPEYQPIDAPAFWKPAARDAWTAIQAHKEFGQHYKTIHEQWLDTQRQFTQNQQQLSEFRRNFEPLGQFLAPYAQQWAREGMDPVSGLRQIMSWRDALMQDPQATILEMAQQFGVDLWQALQDQPYVDQETAALKSELNQLKEEIQQFRSSGEQQQRGQLMSQVEAFASQTDAQGNLLHPFMSAEVLNDMVHFYKTGRATDPETAYKLAVQYSPEYQAHAAAEADRKARELAQQQQQQAASRAQITGKGPPAAPARGTPGTLSLDDAIAATIGGR